MEFGIGYGIAFDGAGTWRFGDDYARNVTIFDADNSSSSHSDNDIKIFFQFQVTFNLRFNGSFDLPWKKFRITLVKQRQTFV